MSQHVVFIGVDGVDLRALNALDSDLLESMGIDLESLGLDLIDSYIGGEEGTETQQVTSSGPGWSTLLTGVWTDEHGITGNSNTPIDSDVDSLFEIIDAEIEDAEIASIVNWSPINVGHFAEEAGYGSSDAVIDFEEHGLSDEAVTDEVVDLINEEAPDFTFLQLDEPDGVGHSYGLGEEYDAALISALQQIKEIIDAVEAREAENPDEDWMVLVTTDHGRDADGYDHGGQSDTERATFIAATEDLADLDGAAPATSVAATILDFLGIDYESYDLASGSVLEGAPDPLPPVVEDVTGFEANGDLALDGDLVIQFSEAVQKGAGVITVRDYDTNAVIREIDVSSDAVTIDGDTMTIDLGDELAPRTHYFVTIDEGAVTDLPSDGHVNDYAGITVKSTLEFWTTGDETYENLLFEDFESLADDLGPLVSDSESGGDGADWTATAPDGWTVLIDTPEGGPVEFYGWTFFDLESWIATAEDQGRSEFTNASGVVAVVDPDEYDDIGDIDPDQFDSTLVSPEIDLSGVESGEIRISFDSSWRYEDDQEAALYATFDTGEVVELLHWTSDTTSADFKADATNEQVLLYVDLPEGASSMTLSFDMPAAGNDWWWAVDNVSVDEVIPSDETDKTPPTIVEIDGPSTGGAQAVDADLSVTFSEDIQAGSGAITLRDYVTGEVVYEFDVTSDAVTIDGATLTVDLPESLEPRGHYYVTIDSGAVTDLPQDGHVNIFTGLGEKDSWHFTTEDTATYTNLLFEDFESLTDQLGPLESPSESGGDGTDWTATAPEGWTMTVETTEGGPVEFNGWTFFDLNSWIETAGDQGRAEFTNGSGVVAVADPDEYADIDGIISNQYDTSLISPEVDISEVESGLVRISFDSSWRYEDAQEAGLTVTFDNGEEIELFHWSSDPSSEDFKADATNETITLYVEIPEGASSMQLSFDMPVAGNDWWWAVDNISIDAADVEDGGETPLEANSHIEFDLSRETVDGARSKVLVGELHAGAADGVDNDASSALLREFIDKNAIGSSDDLGGDSGVDLIDVSGALFNPETGLLETVSTVSVDAAEAANYGADLEDGDVIAAAVVAQDGDADGFGASFGVSANPYGKNGGYGVREGSSEGKYALDDNELLMFDLNQDGLSGVGVSFSIDVQEVSGQSQDEATLANLAADQADVTVDFWTDNGDGTFTLVDSETVTVLDSDTASIASDVAFDAVTFRAADGGADDHFQLDSLEIDTFYKALDGDLLSA